jgi:hypothetical protein
MPPPTTTVSTAMRLGERGVPKACAWCQRVYSCHGQWEPSAAGIPTTAYTHGICDDCVRQHFPEVQDPD